jgi:hypothetical protein
MLGEFVFHHREDDFEQRAPSALFGWCLLSIVSPMCELRMCELRSVEWIVQASPVPGFEASRITRMMKICCRASGSRSSAPVRIALRRDCNKSSTSPANV